MNVPILGVRLDAPCRDDLLVICQSQAVDVISQGRAMTGERREARGARLADAGELSLLGAKNKNRFQHIISTLSEYRFTPRERYMLSLACSAPNSDPGCAAISYPASCSALKAPHCYFCVHLGDQRI
jgi:hypothetical protein